MTFADVACELFSTEGVFHTFHRGKEPAFSEFSLNFSNGILWEFSQNKIPRGLQWISFTVVAILALTASGVGMDSCPESPGGLILFTTFYTFYNTTTLT